MCYFSASTFALGSRASRYFNPLLKNSTESSKNDEMVIAYETALIPINSFCEEELTYLSSMMASSLSKYLRIDLASMISSEI
jgi:hypothetical protein